MDPLTGSVLVTLCICQLGKDPVSGSCELSPSPLPLRHPVQASLFLFMSLISLVTVHTAQEIMKSHSFHLLLFAPHPFKGALQPSQKTPYYG